MKVCLCLVYPCFGASNKFSNKRKVNKRNLATFDPLLDFFCLPATYTWTSAITHGHLLIPFEHPLCSLFVVIGPLTLVHTILTFEEGCF